MRATKYFIIMIAFIVSLCAAPTISYAEGKSIKICNYTGKDLYVAIGWLDYGFPVASGWYALTPEIGCKRVFAPKADTYLPVLAYAFDSAEKEYAPSTSGYIYFCINRPNSFEEKSSSICKAKDEIAKEIVSDWEKFYPLGNPIAESYEWDVGR